MTARSGLTCIRHTLCVVNTTLWVVGCAILSAGIWLRVSYGGYASLLHQYEALSLDSLCVATGVITFVVAFFGCCGAWFRNRCMLMTYFLLLVLVFVLQMVVAVVVFAFRESLTAAIRDELRAGLKYSYNETDANAVATAWNGLQRKFECCGVEGPADWFDISAWPGKDWVPQSCCKNMDDETLNCGKATKEGQWFENGCFGKARMWFIQRLHVLGFVILALTFMQLFGLISSMLLFCNLDHKRRSRTYRSYQVDT